MKIRLSLLAIIICLSNFQSIAQVQKKDLTYYLPDINYDKDIPTPEEYLGYQIGEWHISHDQLVGYFKELAEVSPRITLTEYARSYENRPLMYLTITSEKNQRDLEEIKANHLKLSNPTTASEVNLSKQPIVIYQGSCVHGNEPSGGNASVLVAYYLAAGKSKEVEKLLDEAVILLDPALNPDGFNRFSNWTNVHKNKNATYNNQDREYREVYPGGRTNHYWFDLNRDWLPVQHPESQGRIKMFQEWQPIVATDHHEMGTNATFFFQPGIPSRTNPLTPQKNQDLTAKIGNYHAAALETIGSLYFTQERYDDFYYGKGSTYPDINGSIGILFEQSSSRGTAQNSDNGVLTFPFTIRNQVATHLSTQQASLELREELLEYRIEFFQNAVQESSADDRKAILVSEQYDRTRFNEFMEILSRHEIEVHKLKQEVTIDDVTFKPENSFIIPLEQSRYKLITGIFQQQTTFKDSLFYDVSAWTLPMAFNIEFKYLSRRNFTPFILGDQLESLPAIPPSLGPDYSEYAYLIEWDDYNAPKAVNDLLSQGLRAKVATFSFQAKEKTFLQGTIMIPVQNQVIGAEQMYEVMQDVWRSTGITIHDVDGGLTPEGIDLGSSYFRPLRKPEVLLIAGPGVTSYDAGENWHLLDQRYDIPVTMIEPSRVAFADLS
ncbi:MAG: M14 family zinc carboxypeptidase, partial [Bacteroidota bacterium]